MNLSTITKSTKEFLETSQTHCFSNVDCSTNIDLTVSILSFSIGSDTFIVTLVEVDEKENGRGLYDQPDVTVAIRRKDNGELLMCLTIEDPYSIKDYGDYTPYKGEVLLQQALLAFTSRNKETIS